MILEQLNQEQIELKEKCRNLAKWQSRLKQLKLQQAEAQKRAVELMKKVEKETEDVNRLAQLSWTNLFHTVLGNKQEQTELERQELLAVVMQLQQVNLSLDGLNLEKEQLDLKLANVLNAEADYEQFLKRKATMIKSMGNHSSGQLDEMDEQIADWLIQSKELHEAIDAGIRLVNVLEEAETSLDKAKAWGTWDMLGGGMMATMIKHDHINDAQLTINNAQERMGRFQKELQDINHMTDIRIDIGGFERFADYFFDGLIADWIVQGKINDTLLQVQDQLQKVKLVLTNLDEQIISISGKVALHKTNRIKLIEGE